MILRITNSEEQFGINVYKLSLSEFGKKEYHPFIVTQTWDKLVIDLNEETPKGYIRQIAHKVRVIPVFNKYEVNVKVMQLLCEILPDYSAKLRATFLKDKVAFNKLIEEVVAEYGWKDEK